MGCLSRSRNEEVQAREEDITLLYKYLYLVDVRKLPATATRSQNERQTAELALGRESTETAEDATKVLLPALCMHVFIMTGDIRCQTSGRSFC